MNWEVVPEEDSLVDLDAVFDDPTNFCDRYWKSHVLLLPQKRMTQREFQERLARLGVERWPDGSLHPKR